MKNISPAGQGGQYWQGSRERNLYNTDGGYRVLGNISLTSDHSLFYRFQTPIFIVSAIGKFLNVDKTNIAYKKQELLVSNHEEYRNNLYTRFF